MLQRHLWMAPKKHYYKKKTIYAEALGRAAKLEEENLHLKAPWRIRHTNPKIENQIFLEFHFLPPKYC